ncbi:hypothetical protein [Dactylosporangium sp. CA-233914]|uniref:hypothetical protein n=1 Tax=Dactylosporangium sp. CA-233914 TaxID=3239934 RepID=UPI003D8E4AE1
MPGIFTTEGSDLRIPWLRFDLNSGETSMGAVQLRSEMWDHWLHIAHATTEQAVAARTAVLDAHARDHASDLGLALEDEFRASMTSICAVAFAIDALYGSIKDRAGPHPNSAAWAEKKLARHKQIAEYLRWVFKIGPTSHKEIRSLLSQIFQFRGEAVHPGIEFREAIHRPDIDRGVDPRFIRFRADNAEIALWATLTIIEALLRNADRAPETVKEWATHNRERFFRLTGSRVGEPRPPKPISAF